MLVYPIHGQFIVNLLRNLPLLVVSGIIVLWYLYQVVVGTVRLVHQVAGSGRDDFKAYVIKSLRYNVRHQIYAFYRYKDS